MSTSADLSYYYMRYGIFFPDCTLDVASSNEEPPSEEEGEE